MKLKPIQNLTTLEPMKPLRIVKTTITTIPSELELLLLSSNLVYQSKKIMEGTAKRIGDLTAQQCSYKAIEILNRINDYQNKYLDMDEFRSVRKKFKLNGLYD